MRSSSKSKSRKRFARFVSFVIAICGLLTHCSWILARHPKQQRLASILLPIDSQTLPMPALTLCIPFQVSLANDSASLLPAQQLFDQQQQSTYDVPLLSCKLRMPSAGRRHTQVTVESSLDCRQMGPFEQSINFLGRRRCVSVLLRPQTNAQTSADFRLLADRSIGQPVVLTLGIRLRNRSNDEPLQLYMHASDQLPDTGRTRSLSLMPKSRHQVHFSSRTVLFDVNSCASYSPFPSDIQANTFTQRTSLFARAISHFVPSIQPDHISTAGPRLHPNHSSHFECVSDCLLQSYRQLCRCLPLDFNVKRSQLLPTDLFCDEPLCVTGSGSHSSALDARYELVAKCNQNCPSPCEQISFRFEGHVRAIKSMNQIRYSHHQSERSLRYFYPDGRYFDPHYTTRHTSNQVPAHPNTLPLGVNRAETLIRVDSMANAAIPIGTTATPNKPRNQSWTSYPSKMTDVRPITVMVNQNGGLGRTSTLGPSIIEQPFENVTLDANSEDAESEVMNELESETESSVQTIHTIHPPAVGQAKTAHSFGSNDDASVSEARQTTTNDVETEIELLLDSSQSETLQQQPDSNSVEVTVEIANAILLWTGISITHLLFSVISIPFQLLHLLGCLCCRRKRISSSQSTLSSNSSSLCIQSQQLSQPQPSSSSTNACRTSQHSLIRTA